MWDYEALVRKKFSEMGRQLDVAIFYGTQPVKPVYILGVHQSCPSCKGRGHDDGGPGAWTCRSCEGRGHLRFGRVYRFEKWLPYPKTHPNSGTEYERRGIR